MKDLTSPARGLRRPADDRHRLPGPPRPLGLRDRSKYGLRIDDHEESGPLRSAGPPRATDGLDRTFLAVNGDVLTTVDPRELVRADSGVRRRGRRRPGPFGAHVHNGDWRDIARHDDYEKAQAEIDAMLPELQLA